MPSGRRHDVTQFPLLCIILFIFLGCFFTQKAPDINNNVLFLMSDVCLCYVFRPSPDEAKAKLVETRDCWSHDTNLFTDTLPRLYKMGDCTSGDLIVVKFVFLYMF